MISDYFINHRLNKIERELPGMNLDEKCEAHKKLREIIRKLEKSNNTNPGKPMVDAKTLKSYCKKMDEFLDQYIKEYEAANNSLPHE